MDVELMIDLKELNVTIVGLGLMGGSLALALKGHVKSISAVDINSETLKTALSNDVINTASQDLGDGIKSADLIIAATPVRSIISLLDELELLKPDGCIITDLGSTKAFICTAMERLPPQFEAIGGHPLCGRELSGFSAAQPDLFTKKAYILCPTTRTTARSESLMKAVISVVGSYSLKMPAEEHDWLVSLSSHLPYLLSAVLMSQADKAAEIEPNLWPVTASGFKDMTRLSSSDPSMIIDILLTNGPAIIKQMNNFDLELNHLIGNIERGNEAWLLDWLNNVNESYNRYSTFPVTSDLDQN